VGTRRTPRKKRGRGDLTKGKGNGREILLTEPSLNCPTPIRKRGETSAEREGKNFLHIREGEGWLDIGKERCWWGKEGGRDAARNVDLTQIAKISGARERLSKRELSLGGVAKAPSFNRGSEAALREERGTRVI